jgi:excisionase family DNA binding protein
VSDKSSVVFEGASKTVVTKLEAQLESSPNMITVKMLAELLNIGQTKVYKLVNHRAIPHYRFGKMIRFDPWIIARWVREQL